MGWQPGLVGELIHTTPAGCLLSATSVQPPWPALGVPHHLPGPQEPLHGAHPRGLCRLGGVGAGRAVSIPAASLARVPQGQERRLRRPWCEPAGP